ncbi:TATA-binding protein-associated factor MOT1 [Rhynchospora pubera]|uniref:TATA-binding protein-associated factor MOT1 n=1 Tax=Rhynchospora pubera TaxID=906938 RepID=A0AAV8G3X6_9POAL|nr:TATA-binding protein-associated factor MOT1 [Rhynchospora pubera]
MAQNSSRLQRLLTLLDTGSTQTTRLAAARQIGEIAKSHPQDLNPLLKKVSQYLRSKSWDTRVAAAQAIGAIAENVKHTTLKELLALVEAEAANLGISDISKELGLAWSKFDTDIAAGLTFKSFQISKVLEFGSPLLASGGQEYDVANDNRSPAERLARQKQNLRRRLGLDVCEQFMDVSEVIRDEDLMTPQSGHGPQGGVVINGSNNGNSNWVHPIQVQSGKNIQQLVATMVPGFRPKRLSARELNLLKRKAKSSAKDHTKTLSEDEKSKNRVAAPSVSNEMRSGPPASSKETLDTMAEEESTQCEENGRWPFQHYVDQLIHDIFDPAWEVRHGAMMALREILTHQGSCARVYLPDLTLGNLSLPDFGDKINQDAKRSREEFDLNKQFGLLEENEPDQKRFRFSEEAVVNGANALTEHHVGMKIKPDLGGSSDLKWRLSGESGSMPVSGSVTNISENPKLVKLVRLYQYSCLKNWEFLQDCAIRFLCVLSLDRFGDYVSDQVVAPVRETCAQALGAVLKYMHPSLVNETFNSLLQMQCRQEWEVRHGSLLGIKYLVAVRKEMIQNLLMYVLPACKTGLEDPDDDVRAVAADALIPTAASLVALDNQMLNSIVMLLWDILLDLDDLSPSTSSVMNLLAEIYSQPEMVPKMLDKLISAEKHGVDINMFEVDNTSGSSPYALATLVPRLWPFMRHTITSVRYSAICTLERLLEVNKGSSDGAEASKFWPSSILGDALRIVFQNLLLEANDNILQSSERVWRLLLQCPENELESAAGAYFSSWVQLATTPYGSALDPAKMFLPVALPRRSASRAAAKMRPVYSTSTSSVTILDFSKGQVQQPASVSIEREVSTGAAKIVVGADTEKSVTHTRVLVSTALGVLASKLPPSSWQVVVNPLWWDLKALAGVQRQVASMILATWFKELRNRDPAISQALVVSLAQLKQWLLDLLACTDPSFPTKDSPLPYSELSRTYTKMRHETNHFLHSVKSTGAFDDCASNINLNIDNLTIDEAIEFASKLSVPSELQEVESAKQQLLSTCGYLKCVQNNLHVAVSSLVASAVVWTSELPSRLNPVILPLMAAIKREQEEILQQKAAEGLAELIFSCVARKPSPNDKLIKNLCTLTCADPNETPQATLITSMEAIEEQNLLSFNKVFGSHSRSRHHAASGGEDRSKLEGFISRRGSEMALKHLCEKFGPALFEKLPKVWDCLTELLLPVATEESASKDEQLIVKLSRSCEDKDPQSLINNIQVVRSIASLVHELLRPQLLSLLPCILGCVRHSHVAIRLAASRCVTSMAKSITASVMTAIIETVIPMLSDETSVCARQGAGILVSLLVQGLGVELVPYAPLLVVPLLRCMSDSDRSVRQSVTHSFAALVPLLPLAKGVAVPDGLGERLSSNAEDARFLEQLLDNSHIEDYKLSVDLKVGLRRYQQEGINWLAFLRRFKLHGILCDDMGLGKTLQASAIVATDIAERHVNTKEEKYSDPLSIIVCPSTLVAHWAYEIEKHIDTSVMNTLQYVGGAPERMALQSQFDTCNVVITSYDIIRKDIDFLGKIAWNYCILDEGHIIKSSRSKITSAVKLLKSEHRLILSGTPIQNNVLELWSLFDFLMPGFLGTEKQFQSTYGKPLIAAKDPKCSAKDAEAGILAMEALHKQVMPFLLRRTKDEVLSDLPEKIIQDRYCDLSPLQLKLYEQFSTSNAKEEISTIVKAQDSEDSASDPPKATTHVFQALQYLLKLCSHPLLVLGNQPPQTMERIISEVVPGCRDMVSELHELYHSPKLVALQEILEECGIGLDASASPDGSHGQHRVLIFAQHKALLDIIEKDLFQFHMRSVTYLRLDGTVQAEKRFEIVKAFNSDPTIDVLLLTTHVGGLGLNLTSADTLVFMEHDWNPMKDLQAMDRAHRLGQKKVVNVHRLIMRGTLEEKVMSLQRFKVSVANAVINAENASLKTMNTDQLLDLFASTPASRKGALLSRGSSSDPDKGSKPKGGRGLKSILNGLDELWDQSQYTDEYDMTQFLAKLNG